MKKSQGHKTKKSHRGSGEEFAKDVAETQKMGIVREKRDFQDKRIDLELIRRRQGLQRQKQTDGGHPIMAEEKTHQRGGLATEAAAGIRGRRAGA